MLSAGEADVDEYTMQEGHSDVPDAVEAYAKSAQSTFWVALATYLLPFLMPIVWVALGFVAFKRAEVADSDIEIAKDKTNERGTRLRDGDRYLRWSLAAHAIFLVAFAVGMIFLPGMLA